MGAIFLQNSQKQIYTHMGRVQGCYQRLYALRCYSALAFLLSIVLCALLSTIILRYNTVSPWTYACVQQFLIICFKMTPISAFEHVDDIFTKNTQDITVCKYFRINSLYVPTYEKWDFQKVSSLFGTTMQILIRVNNQARRAILFSVSLPNGHVTNQVPNGRRHNEK